MTSVVGLVRDYLLAQGAVGGSSGWSLFEGLMPADPDRAVVLTQTPGQAPQTRAGLDLPGLQVRIRGEKQAYRATEAKAGQLYDLLHGKGPDELGAGARWLTANHSPALLGGYDEERRPEFSVNFSCGAQR